MNAKAFPKWQDLEPHALVPGLRRSTLFRAAAPSVVLAVAEKSRRVSLPQGYELFRFGEPASQFAVVLEGLVELHRYAPDQQDALLGLFGPGDTVGVPAVLERGRYPISVVAGSRSCEVIAVEAAALLDRISTDPVLANATTEVLLEHIRALRIKIDILSCANLSRGMANLFLELARRFGRREEQRWVVPLELSRARLAQLLSAREETVIRLLGRWKRAGWVHLDRSHLILEDPTALRQLLRGPD